jgi:hypothetical protein
MNAALFAFTDFKSGVADCIEERRRRALHNGAGRLLRLNPALKLLEKVAMTFDFNEDALSRIRHVAVEFQFCRHTVNNGAEADSLHSSTHDHFQSFRFGRGGAPIVTVRRAPRTRPGDMLSRADDRFHLT